MAFEVGLTDELPLVPFEPLHEPEAVQVGVGEAFELIVHDKVDDEPEVIVVALPLKVRLGATLVGPEGVGEGDGDGLGDGDGDGLGEGLGDGDGLGEGVGDADGELEGDELGVGEVDGVVDELFVDTAF